MTLDVTLYSNSFLLNWNQNNNYIYPIVDYKLEVSQNNNQYDVLSDSNFFFFSSLKLSKRSIYCCDTIYYKLSAIF